MRFYALALAMLMMPVAAFAGTAAEVADLQVKVAAAEAKLGLIQEKIAAARGRHAAADAELRRSVRQMVQVRQYPQGFWLLRSVLMDTPMQAELMNVVAREQEQKLVQAQAEAGGLTTLYGEINSQLQAVRDVQAAYGEANGRLVDAERAVLRRAGIQADALSDDLQAALDASVTMPVVHASKPQPALVESGGASGGLPVAGRVEHGFGTAGTTHSGVVLKAAGGAPVRATQAARVLYAGPFRHFGGLVILKTVRGEDVLLGGMGTLSVKAGEDVAAGQALGGAGEDGRIYWELRRSGRVVNPLD